MQLEKWHVDINSVCFDRTQHPRKLGRSSEFCCKHAWETSRFISTCILDGEFCVCSFTDATGCYSILVHYTKLSDRLANGAVKCGFGKPLWILDIIQVWKNTEPPSKEEGGCGKGGFDFD